MLNSQTRKSEEKWQAWQTSGCDRGGSLKLHVCRNPNQLSTASTTNRTCLECGQEFSSRNQLMRHVQSLAHYGREDPVSRATEADPQDSKVQTELKHGGGSKAWELYYRDLPEFQRIHSLMQTFVPYCFRSVPTSSLSVLALNKLQAEATLRRPHGIDFDQGACNCWALTSDESWNFLQAAQDCGAIQRQEAASMVPVMLLQACIGLEHFNLALLGQCLSCNIENDFFVTTTQLVNVNYSHSHSHRC